MKYLLMLTAGLLLRFFASAQGCTTGYVEPDFQLKSTSPSCAANSGSIEVLNLTGGVAPFTYRLIEANLTNSTGVFAGLAPGAYTVELRDACGTVRTRQVTLVPYQFSFDFKIDRITGCNDGEITIDVIPAEANYRYAVVTSANDTVWSTSPTFGFTLVRSLKVIVYDECGNAQVKNWVAPTAFLPYIEQLQYNIQCDKFDIFPVFYGFEAPTVCLYEYVSKKLVECKQAPAGTYSGGFQTNFFNVPWGDYYVIVQDGCFRDSMFFKNPESAGGSQIDPYDWDCSTFKMHVDGPAPPASFYAQNPHIKGSPDSICLYRQSDNSLVGCKPTDDHLNWINPRTGVPWPSGAVWDSLPYGGYYAYIFDPCDDTTYRIDSMVVYPFNVRAASHANCDMSKAAVEVNFDPGTKSPYTVKVYYPDGTLAATQTTNRVNNYVTFNAFPTGGMLRVVAIDGCGNTDTSRITQASLELEKSFVVNQKCPGLFGNGGSGDITVRTAVKGANIRVTPTIIKRNGSDSVVNYSYLSSTSNNYQYFFPNLMTGTYIVEYKFSSCSNNNFYDTVIIQDYIYPYQDSLEVAQCGGNPVTFVTPTVGGLGPYTYQVIGSMPATPSLITSVQPDSVFTVGTGEPYQSIRVRTIDRCGNSAIGDIVVTRIATCEVLDVDSLQNHPFYRNLLAKVYPNPSSGSFTVSINQRKKSDYRIEIVNAVGVKVYQWILTGVDRKDLTVTQKFQPGMYIITIVDVKTGRSSTFKHIVR